MENILMFYMCHFPMGLTHCYKTAVFYIYICSFSTNLLCSFNQMLRPFLQLHCIFVCLATRIIPRYYSLINYSVISVVHLRLKPGLEKT